MKVIAVLQADLEVTPIGTRSRLADELRGVPVLRRTVERVRRVKSIAEVHVLCPSSQTARCGAILAGTGAMVCAHDAARPPWASLVRTARKWSLDGWRGGIGGTTTFEEYTDCRLIDGLLKTAPADAVLSIPPAAPVFDPDLAQRMIDHRRTAEDDARLTFTQAPPGLAGVLLDTALVKELSESNIPIGVLFSYKPDAPRKDLIFQSCCCEIPAPLRFAVGRLIADTERSMRTLAALLGDHESPDATTIGTWLTEREKTHVEPVPREVEIELTTDDPYAHALLRPRGDRVPRRGPIDPALVERVITEMAVHDDALCVLGGFGDPLRHPCFPSILERIRPVQRPEGRDLYGLCVRTSAVDLGKEQIEAIVAHGVDVLTVTLDAWTPDLYGRLQSPHDPRQADLQQVLDRLDRLTQGREREGSPRPIIVPEMTKAVENVHELDAFYDGWLRRFGTVSITGYSHFAGQCPDRSVIKMAPAARTACRRIRSRCLILADGSLAMCDQDFRGQHTLGRLGEQSLTSLWRSAAFERLRASHRNAQYDPTPLCARCEDWHRP